MARARADDYDDKRQAILDQSARLFAIHGFDRASMSRIAEACGVSKALLYHYYSAKDALLYDIVRSHLEHLIRVTTAASETEKSEAGAATPEDRLKALISALLEAYRDADAQHKVQINHLSSLPDHQQSELRAMERKLVKLFAESISAVHPSLKDSPKLKPVTMSLFGMLNWHYLWFQDGGDLSREDYAEMVMRLIADGARNI
ncbi:TetR/AcrR family transcriptional regulator [Coralliovum pocilloporae]|uniref:TetR/AcrR family transcriptional regulator n=1 Tax=Coralliovum pocilloporae TaxID=3066369 RepID=UPI003307794F